MEYFLISGLACWGSLLLLRDTVKANAKRLGYVDISKKESQSTEIRVNGKAFPAIFGKVIGFALNFLPFVNNLLTIAALGADLYLTFGPDDKIEEVLMSMNNFKRASTALKILEKRRSDYNFEDIKDAMIIDGADEETIDREITLAKNEVGACSDKEFKRVKAMSDAELWMRDISMDVDLTWDEEDILYDSYVKDFAKEKTTDNAKAIQKTLRMVNKKNKE